MAGSEGLEGMQSVIKPEELVLFTQVGHTVTVQFVLVLALLWGPT